MFMKEKINWRIVYLSIIARRSAGQKLEEVNKRLGCTQKVEVIPWREPVWHRRSYFTLFFFDFVFSFLYKIVF